MADSTFIPYPGPIGHRELFLEPNSAYFTYFKPRLGELLSQYSDTNVAATPAASPSGGSLSARAVS